MKLKTLLNEEIPGYAPKDVTGLSKAKPGDFIEVGIEGSRVKYLSKIAKVVSNNRLIDTEGNIFNRDGRIFRKVGSWTRGYGKDKIVSARQVTEKEYKKKTFEFVAEQLRKFDWAKLSAEKLKAIGKIIGWGFPQLNSFD